MKYYLILISLISFNVYSQHTISGKITDSKFNNPLENVTIYIDGTTTGTISSNSGDFILYGVKTPCTMVISHINYYTQTIEIGNTSKPEYQIALKQRVVELNNVDIVQQNKREHNNSLFRRHLLGIDSWGKGAKILNDSILFYDTNDREVCNTYDSIKHNAILNSRENEIVWSTDSTEFCYNIKDVFIAKANEPLNISLPLLGYDLQINLYRFVKHYNICQILFYSYFTEKQELSPRQKKIVERNRDLAYYNSTQHFIKSLFLNMLYENGYKIYEPLPQNPKQFTEVDLSKYVTYTNTNIASVIGIANKEFVLYYYPNSMNRPINLWEKKGHTPLESKIYFNSDTCIFTSNGTIPNNSIYFGGAIDQKRLGALLPSDYEPKIKDKK